MSWLLSRSSPTFTHTVANLLGVEPDTLSTQKGSSVVPSSAVNLKSPPSSLAFGKSAEFPSKSKFSPVAPELSPIKSLTW